MSQVVLFSDFLDEKGFARYAGAYRIATELRSNGFTTQVVDFFLSLTAPELSRILKKFVTHETLFVGFSTTMLVNHSALSSYNSKYREYNKETTAILFPQDKNYIYKIFESIKTINPNTKIVIGGSRAPESANLDYPGVDYWVLGNADLSTVKLAQYLHGQAPSPESRPTKSGWIINSENYPFHGFKDASINWSDHDIIFNSENLPLEISRGCAFNCSFCNFSKKILGENSRDPASIKNELLRNFELYGTKSYMITDNTLNDSVQKVEMIHKLFTSLPFQIEYSAYLRLDMLHRNPETIPLLKEAGLISTYFGIETLDEVSAKYINKPLSTDSIFKTLKTIKSDWGESVILNGGLILGLPGETLTSMRKSVDWVLDPNCPLDNVDIRTLHIPILQQNQYLDAEYSKISRDPMKFGYTLLPETGGWISNETSSHDLNAWSSDIYSQQRVNRKKPNFMAYHRLRNIGFSKAEAFSLGQGSPTFYQDALVKKQALKEHYLNQLLALRNHESDID